MFTIDIVCVFSIECIVDLGEEALGLTLYKEK